MTATGKITRSILLLAVFTACFGSWCSTAFAVTADEPIAGYSMVTPAQLDAELSYVNPGHIHPEIAQLYVTWGSRFGIKADLAFSQMLHETNYLRYTGDVRSWQNNFAGIGATGGGNPGNYFPSAEAGVIAHYAHLAWYVYPNHVNEYCNSAWDPRHFGTTHRNTVRTLRDLGGQWAVPGVGYGDALALYATRIWNRSDPFYISFPIIGGIRLKWDSLNWAPGRPLNVEYSVTSANGQVLGQAQDFENGRVIWNPAGGVSWIHGAILAKYDQLGRETGDLGLPTSDEMDVSSVTGARESDFTHGRIYWGPGVGSYGVSDGAIMDKYLAGGGPAVYGIPTSDEYVAGGGKAQNMQKATLTWDGTGSPAYALVGGILDKYKATGGPTGSIGLAVSGEQDVAGVPGARESQFAGGRIFWGPGVGSYALKDDKGFLQMYINNGDAAYLGIPTSDDYPAWDGRGQNFQKAIFTWNPRNNAHYVRGGVMVKYQMTGGPAGYLHLIIDEEKPLSPSLPAHADAVAAIFENGRVYWSGTTGSHIVNGGVYVTYMSVGGPQGRLGLPITDESVSYTHL